MRARRGRAQRIGRAARDLGGVLSSVGVRAYRVRREPFARILHFRPRGSPRKYVIDFFEWGHFSKCEGGSVDEIEAG